MKADLVKKTTEGIELVKTNKVLPTTSQNKVKDHISDSHMLFVILIMSPCYFIIYAYLHLVWQMFSFYFSEYANLFDVCCKNRGKCNVLILAIILLCFYILETVLYVLNECSVEFLVYLMSFINFLAPTTVIYNIFVLDHVCF